MDAWSRRPWFVDTVLAICFVALGQYELRELADSGYQTGDLGLNTVVTALGAAPLALRRWHPPLALALGCLPHAVASVITAHALGFWGCAVPVAILCFGAGRWAADVKRGLLTLAPAAVLMVVYGVHVPEFRHVEDYVVGGVLWFVPWLAGLTIARLAGKEAALRDALGLLRAQEADRARQVVLEERSRIAREMHDVMAHGISVMVVQAGAARLDLTPDPAKARESLLAVEATGRDVLAELRRTVGLLRDDGAETEAAPRGLEDLDELVASTRSAGLAVSLDIDDGLALDPGRSLVVYRVIQEALTNTLRHAGSTDVSVRISQSSEPGHEVWVDVVDAGERARHPQAPAGGGHGLIGASERVAMYGGVLTAGREGDGFAVRARIPREARP